MAIFILRVIANSLAFYLATLLVPSFIVTGGIQQYVLAGLVLALLNTLVKPILKLVSLPIIILTFGLFTFVINAFIIKLVDLSFDSVMIESFSGLFWATIVISAINIVTTHKS